MSVMRVRHAPAPLKIPRGYDTEFPEAPVETVASGGGSGLGGFDSPRERAARPTTTPQPRSVTPPGKLNLPPIGVDSLPGSGFDSPRERVTPPTHVPEASSFAGLGPVAPASTQATPSVPSSPLPVAAQAPNPVAQQPPRPPGAVARQPLSLGTNAIGPNFGKSLFSGGFVGSDQDTLDPKNILQTLLKLVR